MIDNVYKVVQVLLNKNGYGVITPDEFNNVCAIVQAKIFSNIPNDLRLIQNRKIQGYSTMTRSVLEQTLYKLSVTEDLERVDDTPFPFPVKTLKVDSVYVGDNMVSLLPPDQFRRVVTSKYCKPSTKLPVGFIDEDGISVYPGDIKTIEVTYKRNPRNPKWTYKNINGKPVFNPLDKTYQDFELSEHFLDKIVVEIAFYFGIHLREMDLAQLIARRQVNEEQKDNML